MVVLMVTGSFLTPTPPISDTIDYITISAFRPLDFGELSEADMGIFTSSDTRSYFPLVIMVQLI